MMRSGGKGGGFIGGGCGLRGGLGGLHGSIIKAIVLRCTGLLCACPTPACFLPDRPERRSQARSRRMAYVSGKSTYFLKPERVAIREYQRSRFGSDGRSTPSSPNQRFAYAPITISASVNFS